MLDGHKIVADSDRLSLYVNLLSRKANLIAMNPKGYEKLSNGVLAGVKKVNRRYMPSQTAVASHLASATRGF